MKSRASYFGYIFFILIQVVLFIGTVVASEATTDDDWRHFYDISWSDKPSEDIRYAKQLGNDYIVVNPSLSGREYHKNPDCAGLKFYLADPYWYPQVLSGHSRDIDTTKPISDTARDFYNQHMVWKGTDRFPNNLATGHYSGGISSAYAIVWDFQQQAVIDEVVERIIRTIKKYENRDLPFTFGGYILDEPKLSGEFFMVNEQGSNQSVPLSHWTGKDSGLTHDTITHEYSTYTEGRAAFYKQLFRRTRQEWPGMKVVMEQHDIYKDWIEEIKDRADSEELMADALFQKDAGTAFVDNEQSFDSGLITRNSVGITQQDEQGDYSNRLYAAKAAVNGAWYNWFCGTGNTSDFRGITKVPARLKLIRCLPNWDNLNSVSLYDREWNGEVYQSTKSYASSDIIYSRHPKSGKVFAVFLTPSGVVKLNADETVTSVRCTNSFFVESGDGSDDVTVVGDEIRLENKDQVGRGYIFTVSSDAVGNTITTGTETGGTSGRETSDGMKDTTEVSGTDYPGGEVRKIAYTSQTMKEKGVFARMPTDQQTGGTSVWQQVPLRTAAQKAAGLFGGEGMQNLYSISYSYTNPNIVYMCNDVAQILKSTDGGINWAFSHNGFLARAALSVAVSPLNENLVFAAGAIMSASLQTVSPADGIYRTVDGGKNWQQVLATGYYKRFNGGTHFAFANSGVVYAATFDKGLVKSTDNGSTWATIWNPGDELVDIKTHPTNQNILFVVRPYGLWKVTDNNGSVTATRIGAGLPRNPASMVVDQQNPNNVYATVYQYGVYKSTDGGVSFSSSNTGITAANEKEATSIAISPVDGNYLYVYYGLSPDDFYYSHDGGATWQKPVSMDERNVDGYVSGSQVDPTTNTRAGWGTGPIAAHPKDKNIALATGSFYHIKRTTDGGVNWKYSNSGYTGGALGTGGSEFGWDLKNPDRFAFFLVDYNSYLTEDNGSTFRPMRTLPYKGLESTNAGAIDSSTGLIITAVGGWEEQILAKSTDNGVSWKHIPTDDAGNSTLSNYTFIGFHPQNPNIIYAQRFKGTRNPSTQAISWKMLSYPVKAIFKGNGDHVYSFYDKTIYKSTDAGTTWAVHSTLPNPETSAAIYMIAIDPTNENRMYAAVLTNGIYIWNGTTWIKKGVSDGFTKDRFGKWNTLAVAVDPRSPNVVYAGNASPSLGQSNGIFRSTDYGATWQNISYNLGPEFNAFGIGVNPHNGYVYLGSYHGTWKLPPPYGTNSVDTISPTITITGPTSGATYATTNNTLNLSGSASDDTGISTITWSNNKGGGGAASGTTNWSVSGITLVSGDNLITVTARDAAGNTGTDTITVTYTPGKAPQVATGAFYTFDEGKGTIAADTSGNGNDGTINGAAWTTGKNGSGLRFNGVDNYVSIPPMNFNEISISAWFYKNANDTVNADAIFGGWKQNANAQNEEGLELRFYNGRPDTLQFGVITQNSSGVRREGFATYNLGNSVGKWYHVTGTYTKATGEQKLYVNGQLVNTQNHPAGNTVVPLTYYPDMRIGYSRADNGYFNGVIDDVRIYNRALSSQDVSTIYSGNI
ncbi:Dispase autolysis-inducing protein precursor [Candidatus Brocadiaceae bacterium B188]|nr:Dispase autolysis-inducing protein precursor [Candidatus Brocadiaceae bacterium B188]